MESWRGSLVAKFQVLMLQCRIDSIVDTRILTQKREPSSSQAGRLHLLFVCHEGKSKPILCLASSDWGDPIVTHTFSPLVGDLARFRLTCKITRIGLTLTYLDLAIM
jgi:hypothetical protein